jgi:hypothetical protein
MSQPTAALVRTATRISPASMIHLGIHRSSPKDIKKSR